ncbi:MAG: hypothetical protein AUJ49_09200 [Desulfovibrionaceae bacterium CG1_02_65_16]|nr:MAG: hypothetical protein AUJ49_09200 [Desulfovibrionaceae bacterium CG1_02_65_16]
MSDALSQEIAGRFNAFAAPYLAAPGDSFAYTIKVEHTMRVLALADTISREERLPAPLPQACRVAALLHDVGRFPQYEMFRTFRDAQSANHAALSVRHTLRARLLDGAPQVIRRLAIGAVYLHNKRTLPPLRNRDLGIVARVVRDSDKLDIYKIMLDHFSQQASEHPELTLDVRDEPDAYSQGILDAVLNHRPGDYRDIIYINDFKLMIIGWVYDLNFRASFRLLQKYGYLETLFASLPQDEQIRSLDGQIHAALAARLNHA